MTTSSISINEEETDSIKAENMAKSSMHHLQDEMSGAAAKAGLESEDEVMDLISEMREELYAKLKKGLEDIEQGRTRPLDKAFDEIKEMLEKRRKEIEK